MQYVKTLLSVSLIFGAFHVQAETQTNLKGNPMVVTPSSNMQVAHSNDVGTSPQAKESKVPTAPSQSRVSNQNHTYEVPLGDYNNGGHFGK